MKTNQLAQPITLHPIRPQIEAECDALWSELRQTFAHVDSGSKAIMKNAPAFTATAIDAFALLLKKHPQSVENLAKRDHISLRLLRDLRLVSTRVETVLDNMAGAFDAPLDKDIFSFKAEDWRYLIRSPLFGARGFADIVTVIAVHRATDGFKKFDAGSEIKSQKTILDFMSILTQIDEAILAYIKELKGPYSGHARKYMARATYESVQRLESHSAIVKELGKSGEAITLRLLAEKSLLSESVTKAFTDINPWYNDRKPLLEKDICSLTKQDWLRLTSLWGYYRGLSSAEVIAVAAICKVTNGFKQFGCQSDHADKSARMDQVRQVPDGPDGVRRITEMLQLPTQIAKRLAGNDKV
jgi:hypothetical protein